MKTSIPYPAGEPLTASTVRRLVLSFAFALPFLTLSLFATYMLAGNTADCPAAPYSSSHAYLNPAHSQTADASHAIRPDSSLILRQALSVQEHNQQRFLIHPPAALKQFFSSFSPAEVTFHCVSSDTFHSQSEQKTFFPVRAGPPC